MEIQWDTFQLLYPIVAQNAYLFSNTGSNLQKWTKNGADKNRGQRAIALMLVTISL